MALSTVVSCAQDEDEENEIFGVDYIRAVILDEAQDHVLMLQNDNGWDLPLLVYEGMLDHEVHRFCKDLQSALAIDSERETDFVIVFELFGSLASAHQKNIHTPGFLKLMVVEYLHSHENLDDKLPQHAEWKDACFVSKILERSVYEDKEGSLKEVDKKISLEEVISLLQSPGKRLKSLREPRHHFGWFKRVSYVLCDVAERCGHGKVKSIIQLSMGPNSTVLQAGCENGALFLKCPLSVSREGSILRMLEELFPKRTPEVLELNEELNLFVTKGFHDVKLSEGDIPGICQEAGRLQLSSREYLAELESAGCEQRGPKELKCNVSGWLDDPVVRKSIRGSRLDDLKKFIEIVQDYCDQLSSCSVPMTLVHGDLYKHNATRRFPGGGYMLYDYEYAYIGHPFCDLSTIYEDMTDEDVVNYLRLWLEYDTLEGLRKSFGIACKLGWSVRLWKVFDDIRVCDTKKNDELVRYAIDCFDEIYGAMTEDDIS